MPDIGITFDKVFTEKVSAKDTNREAFLALIEYLREGYTLHVHCISRLVRNTTDLLSTVVALTKRGVAIQCHKEGIKTGDNSPTSNLVLVGYLQLDKDLVKMHKHPH